MNNQEVSTAYVGSTEIKECRLGSQLVLAPNGDALWYKANEIPTLDLRFADNKSLVDATTGANLVTFSRASGGTYVDSQGVIRNATTNLLLQSAFASGWSFVNASFTETAVAPDGSNSAQLLNDSSAVAAGYVYQGVSVTSGVVYTLSCFAKASGLSSVLFQNFTQAGAVVFTLAGSGSVGSSSGTFSTPTITALAGGWYRCTVTYTASSTQTVNIGFSTNNGPFTGNAFYLWGAQLEQSSTVGEYIPTTSTINSAPRFDHDPSTGESLGLLVEEARTNSIRNNTMVGAVAGTPGTLPTNWAYAVAGTGVTREVVGTGVDNGIAYIDFRFSGTTGSTSPATFGIDRGSALTGQSWTGSLYWKLVGGSAANISSWNIGIIEETAGFTFVTGATYPQTPPGDAFTRVTATRTLSGGATVASCLMTIPIVSASGVAIDFTLRIGMPQLEQGAFATSVIPTSGTAATRAADVAGIFGTNFDRWYNQSQGTIFTSTDRSSEFSASVFAYVLAATDGTANSRIALYRYSEGRFRVSIATGAVSQAAFDLTPYVLAGTNGRAALTYALNDVAACANGGSIGTDNSVTLPTMNRLVIGDLINTSSPTTVYNGTIRRLVYWEQRLPNNVLQAITQ